MISTMSTLAQVWVPLLAAASVMDGLLMQQVCGQQGLAQGVDQGGALGPADMVALAAAYPLVFIQVPHITDILSIDEW